MLAVTQAIAARGEAKVEAVAGMNTLMLDDPPSEVVDDDKPSCVGGRALRSPVVDVHNPNEMSLGRTMHSTEA